MGESRTFFMLAVAACLCFTPTLAVDPLVDVGNTKYLGTALPNGVSQWLGMRFAAPPLGNLRFRAPVSPPTNRTTQIADKHGSICLGTGGAGPGRTHDEDCLFLDVFAPSNATPASKLPVMFFIQGGGLNTLSNANYNGSQLIEAANHEMIVVTHNYRVGTFGFLASKEIQENGNVNTGFLDQRKALQWVQDHISKFGGDPGHVVLSGDSAGAQSITVQLYAFGGAPTNLFHGVIAESQSFPGTLNISGAQFEYDAFVQRTGCGNATDTLACLRGLDTATLQSASIAIPFPGRPAAPDFLYGAVLDGDLIQDLPFRLFRQGKFVDVPSVFGDDTNEGTVFTPTNLNTTSDMDSFLLDNFPLLTDSQLATINKLYPESQQFPGHGAFYFNAASAYGELRYICPGVFVSRSLRQFNRKNTNWLYHYNVEDPTEIAQGLGVPHTIEINAIWGLNSTKGTPPASYFTTNANIVPVMQGYWTSFVRTLNPNTLRAPGTPEWQPFNGTNRILFETNNTRMEVIDAGLEERCDFLLSIGEALGQ
ncbi:triacylglycerol lipase [Trametopsis cervina]|nr:triacylglycerol lipase [Trametopsis cervina]